MKKPKTVPVEAEFNSSDNQWELGIKNDEGKKVGEWKYWWATTGHFCCHTFWDETAGKLTYTRFHPDGTYSQKGTLVNGILDGTIYYQKSEQETTELVLTEPLYKHVFRVICEVKDGQAIRWQYFNKEDAPVDLAGRLALTAAEFDCNFPGFEIPRELSLLLSFEQQYGRGWYADGFSLAADGQAFISMWSKEHDFLKRLLPFAIANGGGAVYAIWDDGNGGPLNKMPVVVFGDEGGVHVVAKDVSELMQLLTFDKEISVYHDQVSFYKDETEHTGSQYASFYKEWILKEFDMPEITRPSAIIQSAQDTYKAPFDTWLLQYYNA